ncbi:hypothetical protein CPB83DRAFT_864773 [Crepidotus variabilis]|uniref:RING-type domain-containing protein n=1 Tax=Crepidotus variabilis TaxID=179855 RepID=A0A9P6E492_9AGAR|nr:hypothetical protein CPB83DRAFT_864773 [Crepidotus variabilis]
MSEAGRGLPLLSGPPPPQESTGRSTDACRKCNKEFNVLFTRSRRCNHCGYTFCHSCTDYQALMPRTGNDTITGYDPMNVCGFCIEYLTITASGRTQLKGMAMSKLKNYLNVYNIKTERVVEKDDLIDAVISARAPNGCLPRVHENFYRKNSVPNRATGGNRRGFFNNSRSGQPSSSSQPPPPQRRDTRPEFARPDLEPDNPPPPPPREPQPYATRNTPPRPQPSQQRQQQQQHYSPPPGPPPRPHSAYGYAPPQGPPPQFHTPPQQGPYGGYNPHYHQASPPQPQYNFPHGRSPPQQQHNARNPGPAPPPPPRHTNQQQSQSNPGPPPAPPPRPRAASTAPPPTLQEMLTMTPDAISSMSIGNLKRVLFTNHVNAGQILEKSELVRKVMQLVDQEKRERERQQRAEEMEEMERIQRDIEAAQERENAERDRVNRGRDQRRDQDRDVWDRAGRGEPTQGTSHDQDGSDQLSVVTDSSDGDWQRGRHYSRSSSRGHTRSRSPANTSSSPPKPMANSPPKAPPVFSKASVAERTGLCVVCQDEEANIAIVDCGHLAMCRGCSDLIMSSSRECPLCRTRIVTESRLLRIFKT